MDLEKEEEEEISVGLFRSSAPLEIPCILNQILKHLPYQDVQRSRLVCRNWNEESCRVLRKRSKIVLNSPKRFIAFNLEMLNPMKENRYCEHFQLINAHVQTPAVTMFLEKFQNCIKGFELKDSKWNCHQLTRILTDIKYLEELIIHGAIPKDSPRLFLTELESGENNQHGPILSSSSSSSSSNANTTTTTHPPKLPNIKQLDLQLYDKLPDDNVLTKFASDILSATHNLETLASRDTGNGKTGKRERFQRVLFELLINPEIGIYLPKLKKVGFSLSPWNDDQIRTLALKKFPLQYLNLTILQSISTTALTSLLISFKNTLKKLKLSFTSWRIIEFPTQLGLVNLQHLSLDWFNGSVAFISELPKLRSLILAEVDLNEMFNDGEISKFNKRPSTAAGSSLLLSSLEVYQHSGTPITSGVVKNLSTVFPKLKTLVLGKLNDDSLRTVFSAFPLLETFEAIEGVFTDFGVIGVDPILCGVCKKEHLQALCAGVYDEGLIIRTRQRHGNIADLHHLRKLVLRSPHITNLSVIHGVTFCQRLKSLSLWSYEMNFRSLKKIVDTFSLDYLESTHTFGHIAEIQYALAKMMGKKFILNGIVAPTFASSISPEIRDFLTQFHDNVCRSILSHMKARASPPYDNDLAVYHNMRHQHRQNLFLIYEACMAEQYALQGLISIGNAI